MAKSKIKSTLFRSKFLFAVFAVGFAGLGTYLITNSSAGPATGAGGVSVRVVEAGVNGVLNGNVVPNATIHIVAVPLENTYNCSQAPSPTDWGTSTGTGTGFFTCTTWNGGRLYQADAGKAGYTSLGARQFTIFPGANTQINLTLRLNDTDGDGVADLSDACPNSGNAGYGLQPNGCPNPAPPPNVSFPTDLTVRYSPIEYGSSTSMYWNAINGTACSLERAPVTNGAIGAFGNGISTPIGVQERNPGTLTSTTAFRVYCSGVNGGQAGYSSARIVTVNPQKPGPTCAEQGKTGVYPNCQDPKPNTCPADAPGNWPNCVKIVTTNTTNTRVVTRTSTAPANASDKEKPSVPANFSGKQQGGGEVDLTWDASTDNVGVTGYTLERSSDSGSTWTMLDENITETSYGDTTAEFGTTYSYRLSAKDAAGNFSDYVVADIETNEFQANITADEDSTITSDDGIVEVEFPAGALKEDAFCEISKDSVSGAPKGYKLAAGGYTITCRNKAGDSITEFDKELKVTMHLKSYAKKYSSFVAYSIDGSSLTPIQATFDSTTGDLKFELKELVTFAAYGAKKGSAWWIWVVIALVVVGLILLILKLRNGGGGGDDYYDTTDYVSMPPNSNGPLDTGAGGYEHHPSLPEMVNGGQPQYPPQQYPPQQGQPQPGPNDYPNPPLPPQQ